MQQKTKQNKKNIELTDVLCAKTYLATFLPGEVSKITVCNEFASCTNSLILSTHLVTHEFSSCSC